MYTGISSSSSSSLSESASVELPFSFFFFSVCEDGNQEFLSFHKNKNV